MTRVPFLNPLLRAAATALVAISLSGCGGGDKGGEASSDSFPRDTLVIAYQSDADSLLSVVSQSAADSAIIDNLNYPLTDSTFDCSLEYVPALAKSWDWSEDGRVISMELRDDIYWNDGERVTAQDVAFTMELVEDPRVASPRISYIEQMVPGKRPLVIDDTHLEWHFTHAYDPVTQLAHVSSLAVVPQHILEDADRATLRGHQFTREPLVNGRWKLGSWDRGEKIVLEPNDQWTGPEEELPKLRRVIFRILPEYATRLMALERGEVDFLEGVQIADADRLVREHPEIVLHRRGWRFLDYVAWNPLDPEAYKEITRDLDPDEKVDLQRVPRHPLFGDRQVRIELARAIDVDKLIADLLTSRETGEKYGRPAVGTITPALCDVHNDDIERFPFDPAAAKEGLAILGWEDHDGDGILDRDGVPFRFTLMTNSGNPRRAKAAVIIQAGLKEIGIDVRIEQIESNTFFERLRKKDYEAALSGWSAGLFVDPKDIWHSGPEYEFNFVSYDNPEVDRLIEEGLMEADPAKAREIWHQLQALVYADQPYAFLYWMDQIVAVHQRFQEVNIDILSPINRLHEWWVPADQVKYKR
jgi:peptide/nickel transport system substrate-binding protein